MNVIGLREAKSKLTALGTSAQRGKRALVTRRGRPFFVVVGVEGEDLVDVLIRWDPSFWKDLEERRERSARTSVSLEEFEQKHLARDKPKRRKKGRGLPASGPPRRR
jgi:prevent-host-death family protein